MTPWTTSGRSRGSTFKRISRRFSLPLKRRCSVDGPASSSELVIACTFACHRPEVDMPRSHIRLRWLSRSLIVLFLTAHVGLSQTPAIPRKALNGEWTGTLVLDNSSPKLSLVFALTDSAFAGKVFLDGDLAGPMEGGSLNGATVHFKVGRFDFTGVVAGPKMTVDLIVFNASTKSL